jgi:hypothetical protein
MSAGRSQLSPRRLVLLTVRVAILWESSTEPTAIVADAATSPAPLCPVVKRRGPRSVGTSADSPAEVPKSGDLRRPINEGWGLENRVLILPDPAHQEAIMNLR